MAPLPRLMLVTNRYGTRGRPLVPVIRRAVEGGVGLVQVREKDLGDTELEDLVKQVRRATGRRALIVVNGQSRVARHTHGLHLSSEDLPLPARRWEEGEWLVGRSARNDEELTRALDEEVSYVVTGGVYPAGAEPGPAEESLGRLSRLSRAAWPIPVFAAGGITVARVPEVVHAGAWGVAVGAAILSATHPGRVAQAMTAALRVAGPPFP